MKKINQVVLVSLTVLIFGCQTDFDSVKWKSKYDGFYPQRKKMVKSLIDSELLFNNSQEHVIEILGPTDSKDTLNNGNIELTYNVQESYGWDIDPRYTVNLKLQIDTTNNTVVLINLVESEDRRSLLEKITTD
ncbi:hypothetical protein QSV08_16705 [Maribacter sp. BPC-D8]|uniref:hypothetical protein n=1 Tax=Maribacter sp. BPC-D8 TaxID=3053613 RepID=UPI002B48F97B|nr:hypothetical protein [Maribacter sp. BPC-D8]WRI28850.1 hypothetical protein QSV08_16705 [Maribacter sp. BPC-D8]